MVIIKVKDHNFPFCFKGALASVPTRKHSKRIPEKNSNSRILQWDHLRVKWQKKPNLGEIFVEVLGLVALI